MKTVLETIDAGAGFLEKHGIDDARRNMQLLVAHQLKCTRTQLYMNFDQPMQEADLVPLREALKQRAKGVPLQHLLGTVEFYRREFKSDKRALIPRPETEELVSIVLKQDLPEQPRILDVGTGSGVLGLSLAAEIPGSQAVLVDISPEALALAKENSDLLTIPNASFIESDLFAEVEGEFDLVVANLPYVAERDRAQMSKELAHDPDLALFSGEDGLDCLRRFCEQVSEFLKPGALVALEVGYDQGDRVGKLLQDAGLSEVSVASDLSGIRRFPMARKPFNKTLNHG